MHGQKNIILPCIHLFILMFLAMPTEIVAQYCSAVTGTLQTKVDCTNEQVLQPLGLSIGRCVASSTFSTPQDVVLEPSGDAGHIISSREGGKGYYIDVEAKELKLCPLGYYCPLNETSGTYNFKRRCKDGEFCWTGSITPTKCSALISCSNGCRRMAGVLGIIVFVVLGIALLTLCVATKIREHRMLQEAQHALDEHLEDSLEEFGQKFKLDIKPVGIEFQNMGMAIKGAQKGTPPILENVSGHFPPSSLVALMGPSGCGKTTFMNAIIDRAPYGIISGTVKINGVANGLAKAQNVVGFVPQDDIVHGDLTVYQNLYYHGKLRLPASTTNEDMLQHVANCIAVLGLGKIQDKIVGTPEQRGVSGGQKKRVNIGLELVAMPSIMFMDEPTSGLDGAATVNIARCLAQLKKTGLTIICVIHQPRWLVFKEFTHLLLLGEGGQQIYSGRTEFMVNYMMDLGFRPAEGENPADWMIDVCSDLEKRYKPDGSVDMEFECPQDLYKEWATLYAADAINPSSKWHQGDKHPPDLQPLHPRKTAGVLTATYYICGRIFRKSNLQQEVSKITIFCFLALMDSIPALIAMTQDCGAFNWEMLNGQYERPFMFAVFINMQHRYDFGEEKLMITREVNSGVAAASIWLGRTAKSIVFATLKFVVYALVLYIFNAPMQNFFQWTIAWVLLGLWWVGFAQVISLAVKDQMTAVLILLMVPLFEGLLSGNYCRLVMDTDAAEAFCPRKMVTINFYFYPGHWFWRTLWIAELNAFPDYVNNFPVLNKTAYWMDVPSHEVKTPGTTLCGTEYTSTLFSMTGGGWEGAVAMLIIQIMYYRLIVLVLLSFMSSGTNKFMADKIARCTHCCQSFCGMCHLPGYSAPHDEWVARRAKTGTFIDSPVGEPVRVAKAEQEDI